MKPPINPLCTWQGKAIQYKCIDSPSLIQSDEDPCVVITFHSQTSRCYNTAHGSMDSKELTHSIGRKNSRSWSDWAEHLKAIEESFNRPLKKCYYIANPVFLWEMITGLAALWSALSHTKWKSLHLLICLPLTSRNTTPDSRGTRAWDWKWYRYPLRVSGGKARVNLGDVCLLSKLTFY